MTTRTVRADEVRVGDTIVLPNFRENPREHVPTEVLIDTIETVHFPDGDRLRLEYGIGRERGYISIPPAARVRLVDRTPRSNHQAPPAIDLPIDALAADLDLWWSRLPHGHRVTALNGALLADTTIPGAVLSKDDLDPWWYSLRPAQRLTVYRAIRPQFAPVAERLAAEAAGWSRLIDALELATRPNTPETTP